MNKSKEVDLELVVMICDSIYLTFELCKPGKDDHIFLTNNLFCFVFLITNFPAELGCHSRSLNEVLDFFPDKSGQFYCSQSHAKIIITSYRRTGVERCMIVTEPQKKALKFFPLPSIQTAV